MGTYTVTIRWKRSSGESFVDNKYYRGHTWIFDGGIEVAASSSPRVVPLPLSKEDAIDPEEAFVASLSSCHMLWFLSIAAEKKFIVERYDDHPEGILAKNAEGRLAMVKVTLKPEVSFSGGAIPTGAEENELHKLAHEKCFIAHSVRTEICIIPN